MKDSCKIYCVLKNYLSFLFIASDKQKITFTFFLREKTLKHIETHGYDQRRIGQILNCNITSYHTPQPVTKTPRNQHISCGKFRLSLIFMVLAPSHLICVCAVQNWFVSGNMNHIWENCFCFEKLS